MDTKENTPEQEQPKVETPETPAAAPAAPATKKWYKSWKLWTGIAAFGAIGGAVAAYYLTCGDAAAAVEDAADAAS